MNSKKEYNNTETGHILTYTNVLASHRLCQNVHLVHWEFFYFQVLLCYCKLVCHVIFNFGMFSVYNVSKDLSPEDIHFLSLAILHKYPLSGNVLMNAMLYSL